MMATEESHVMAARPAFSVCICTRNRPVELRTAIASVLASEYPAHQLIVSDDSTDFRTQEMVAAEFPAVRYLRGPRQGLGANRNNALLRVTGTHVLFIDDDVRMDPHFLRDMAATLRRAGDDADRVILTGTEINRGERVFPHKQSFLGFQALDYQDRDRLYSIVINATVFPAAVFRALKFDQSLVYGYEEIDFTARAVFRHGFEVRLAPDIANEHFPSETNRDFYAPFTEASRIYVTFKKYFFLERKRSKAVAFLAVATAHNLAFNLRHRGLGGFARFFRTASTSLTYLHRCARAVPVYV